MSNIINDEITNKNDLINHISKSREDLVLKVYKNLLRFAVCYLAKRPFTAHIGIPFINPSIFNETFIKMLCQKFKSEGFEIKCLNLTHEAHQKSIVKKRVDEQFGDKVKFLLIFCFPSIDIRDNIVISDININTKNNIVLSDININTKDNIVLADIQDNIILPDIQDNIILPDIQERMKLPGLKETFGNEFGIRDENIETANRKRKHVELSK